MRRQAAILSAARELALRDGVRKVSLADIAARAGNQTTTARGKLATA